MKIKQARSDLTKGLNNIREKRGGYESDFEVKNASEIEKVSLSNISEFHESQFKQLQPEKWVQGTVCKRPSNMDVQVESEAPIFHQDDELSQIKVSDSDISVKSQPQQTMVKETSAFKPTIEVIIEDEKPATPATCLKFFACIETQDHQLSYMIS